MSKNVGSLEQLLMFAVVRLGTGAHGQALRCELEQTTGRRVSPGAIYTTMERLERQGLVTSWIGDDRPVGGGRRRKFYRVEPEGARALAEGYESLRALARGVMPTLSRLALEGADAGAGGKE